MNLREVRQALGVLKRRYEELLDTVVERVSAKPEEGAFSYGRDDDESELAHRVQALQILISALQHRVDSAEPKPQTSVEVLEVERTELGPAMRAALARRTTHRLQGMQMLPAPEEKVLAVLLWEGLPDPG